MSLTLRRNGFEVVAAPVNYHLCENEVSLSVYHESNVGAGTVLNSREALELARALITIALGEGLK